MDEERQGTAAATVAAAARGENDETEGAEEEQGAGRGLGDDDDLEAALLEVGGFAAAKVVSIIDSPIFQAKGGKVGGGSVNEGVDAIGHRVVQTEEVGDAETGINAHSSDYGKGFVEGEDDTCGTGEDEIPRNHPISSDGTTAQDARYTRQPAIYQKFA